MKKRIFAIILLLFIMALFLLPFLKTKTVEFVHYEQMQKIENTQLYNEILNNEIEVRMGKVNAITNKKEWFIAYKKMINDYSNVLDKPESIYDYYTEEELSLLFHVVQAEIGDYTFEQKCNVASVIFNRLEHEQFNNTIHEILTSDQFSTISNGRIHNVTVDEETILACEYVFMFGDTTDGALFFDSNGALNYRYLFNDGAHNFYDLGGYDE